MILVILYESTGDDDRFIQSPPGSSASRSAGTCTPVPLIADGTGQLRELTYLTHLPV